MFYVSQRSNAIYPGNQETAALETPVSVIVSSPTQLPTESSP